MEQKNKNVILFLTLLCCVMLLIILPIYMLLILSDDELKGLTDEATYNEILALRKENNIGNNNHIQSDDFYFPIDNFITITAMYGYYDPYNSGTQIKHTGLDICGKKNSSIFAVLDGDVIFSRLE